MGSRPSKTSPGSLNDVTYNKNSFGLMEKTVDFRRHFLDKTPEKRPQASPQKLYVDSDFPLYLAGSVDAEWKRPIDIRSFPKLFTESPRVTARADVQQGSVGNCWFVSVVANIADDQDKIKQIIPDSSYYVEDPARYDGIFHTRFYNFGKWRDVYIDDYLPVGEGDVLLGACSTKDNEMWVSLLEKAFAKLHGSYSALKGGLTEDAYLELTSGVGERVELKHFTAKDLYNRIKNALSSACEVTCSSHENLAVSKGIISGHSYSLVAAEEILEKEVLKIRNPWGTVDWKEAWSEGSPEWKKISLGGIGFQLPKKEEGEFFVSLEDFMMYFTSLTFCSMTPDFDMDGHLGNHMITSEQPNCLNHVLHIYGEWFDETAAGFHDVIKNPKFSIVVPDKGVMADGRVPVFIQAIQRSRNRQAEEFGCKCYVLKVIGDLNLSTDRYIVYEDLDNFQEVQVFTRGLQTCHRFRLEPGVHLVVPCTKEVRQMEAFLLRVFTSAPIRSVQDIAPDVQMMPCRLTRSVDVGEERFSLSYEKLLLGRFVRGVNDGGQISFGESYKLNPQFLITLPAADQNIPLVVHIMQRNMEPLYPLGIRLYPVSADQQPPLDFFYLNKCYETCHSNLEGQMYAFVKSLDVCVKYLLPTGRFVAVVHLDKPRTERVFSVLFQSTVELEVIGFQTGIKDV